MPRGSCSSPWADIGLSLMSAGHWLPAQRQLQMRLHAEDGECQGHESAQPGLQAPGWVLLCLAILRVHLTWPVQGQTIPWRILGDTLRCCCWHQDLPAYQDASTSICFGACAPRAGCLPCHLDHDHPVWMHQCWPLAAEMPQKYFVAKMQALERRQLSWVSVHC